MSESTKWDMQYLVGKYRYNPISQALVDELETHADAEFLSAIWHPTEGSYAALAKEMGEDWVTGVRVVDLIKEMRHKEDALLPLVDTDTANLVLSYPLGNPAYVTLKAKGGLRAILWEDAIAAVAETYAEIYQLETTEVGDPGQVGPVPASRLSKLLGKDPKNKEPDELDKAAAEGRTINVLNRSTSDGAFKIWGHEITDLALTGFKIIREAEVTWILPEIES